MPKFRVGELVVTAKEVRAGYAEGGPFVCSEGIGGTVLEVDPREWDGVNVALENGTTWWFKPNQLSLKD
jgi:hypothetical protein